MKYNVEYTRTALEQLKKMDKKIVALIITYIDDKLVDCENPRQYGKALQVHLNDIWRYRIGHYRILGMIQDDRVVIAVVEVGHKRHMTDSKLAASRI